MPILWVSLGGAIGAFLRFALSQAWSVALPWGVFAVNTAGSFALGLLLGLKMKHGLSDATMFFFATGLLGAFTTFSTFSWENYQLIEQSAWGLLLLNILGQALAGVAALALGKQLAF